MGGEMPEIPPEILQELIAAGIDPEELKNIPPEDLAAVLAGEGGDAQPGAGQETPQEEMAEGQLPANLSPVAAQ
jgi:hypothetical protein